MRAVMQAPGTPTRGFRERHAGLATALLACGIVAPVFYIVMNDVVAASIYPGYDRIARPVSELSATYAPSRSVLVALGLVFELLMIAFWIGVWQAARQNRALHVTTALMLGFAALGLLAFPFPMRTDEVLGANTIHTIIWGAITPVLMLAGIGVSAAAFGKIWRFYALATLVALVVFSLLTGILAGQVNAGGTAPWFGIPERAIQGAAVGCGTRHRPAARRTDGRPRGRRQPRPSLRKWWRDRVAKPPQFRPKQNTEIKAATRLRMPPSAASGAHSIRPTGRHPCAQLPPPKPAQAATRRVCGVS